MVEKVGGGGPDTLEGTVDSDSLYGHGANDTLYGLAGNDFLYGHSHADHLEGGDDDDSLFGGIGDDWLYGQAGSDILNGEAGYDYLNGGAGDDTLLGGDEDDRLEGHDGNDNLDGGVGLDNLYGGTGADIIEGGDGHDNIHGDTGQSFEGDGSDQINGGSGFDHIRGNGGDDTITGGLDDDELYGGVGADSLDGGEGNDFLDGFGETVFGGTDVDPDVLVGGTGDDILVVGRDDSASGGEGNDLYLLLDSQCTFIEYADEGIDEVDTELGYAVGVQQQRLNAYRLPANIENLTGSSYGQGLRGNSLDNVITAYFGPDYIDATDGGSDTVSSGDGRDVIYYGSALDAGDANDAGGEGGDTRGDLIVIQGDYSAGLILGADALIDIEKFRVLKAENTSFGHDGTGLFDYVLTTVDANVAAGSLLVVQGGSLQVGETLTFNGSAETDGRLQIFGGRDNDIIEGGSGEDHLLGRAGDDRLVGNAGNDRFRGGTGNDLLEGGEGADTFIYAALPNHATDPYTNAALESTSLDYDTILGFDFAEDRIELPQAVTSLVELIGGSLSEASFDANLAAAVDATLQTGGAVLFRADAGDHADDIFLIVDGDGNGAYQADLDFVIHLAVPVGTAPATPDFFV